MKNDPIVIVSVARTPMGSFNGELKKMSASELGSAAIRAAVERSGVEPEMVQEAVMGCVLPAGQGQAPARQAAVGGGLPLSTGCTTINKMCGSGMKAVMFANDMLLAETNEIMVAGGMESMTNAPYILPKARQGYRMGHNQVQDHMFIDGLEDAFEKGRLMGSYAEECADSYSFSRKDQDGFAIRSLERAKTANEDGSFAWEIIPVAIKAGKDQRFIEADEQPFKADIEKIPYLKPAFRKNGTVTAANSSSISDGAAAMVMMRLSKAVSLGIKPLAKIVGHSTHSHEPGLFTTAPIGAIKNLFSKTGWSSNDADLYEVNEAFAVVTMAAMKEFKLGRDRVNVHGGACALGHPVGASGSRIIVSLISALRKQGGKKGVASLCIGGGEATAMAIELIE